MNLEQSLAAFDRPPVQGVVSKPTDPTKVRQEIVDEEPVEENETLDSDTNISDEGNSESSAEDLQKELEGSESESEETEEVEEDESEEENISEEFNTQFKEAFGIDVNEARELVNDLQNFRSENALMREWGINPTEYDSRITRIREFYNGLPEEGREKFNSPEGAKAIWNHISKNDSSKKTKAPKRTRGTLGKSQNKSPKSDLIKRSEILKMSDSDYKANYSKISKAFAENRVIEDV